MKKKKFKIALCSGVLILALAGIFLLLPQKCSAEKLRDLRAYYPASSEGNTSQLVSLAPMPRLETFVERADNYVYVTILGSTDDSSKTLEDGFSKAGSQNAGFHNYKAHVKKVIFGDGKLKDQEIILTLNQNLSAPTIMEEGTELILPVSATEDGKYGMGRGAYYVADGYVLSCFQEHEKSVYSGMKVGDFMRKLKGIHFSKLFGKD